MARILYGVHGTGHGHAMRGLILARAMPQHEFLFVANDDAPGVLEPEFKVARLPNLGTVFRNYQVDLGATIARAAPTLLRRKEYINQALRLIERFQPDVCMADLEYFVPKAAEAAGIPCMALDHQHVLTCCRHDLPSSMYFDVWLQGLTPRWLFRPAPANVIISFYAPPVKKNWNAMVAPPILRQKTLDLTVENKDHILVYQSNSTDKRLLDFLKNSTKREAHVFGYSEREERSGNIIFHKKSEDKFMELLAQAAYVIQGGSHTLMSEALYLGKPVLSIPLLAMVEQRLNAHYLEKLGYGSQTAMAQLNARLLDGFEKNLDAYRKKIAGSNFLGNSQVFELIDNFANSKKLPQFNILGDANA